MELDKKQIDAILYAVKEAGFKSTISISLSEEDHALYWIKEAEKAWIDGAKDEVIQTILNISPKGFHFKKNEKMKNVFNKGFDYIEKGLPIPKDIDEDATDLPIDFTILSDEQLRRFHSSYNAYLARARFLLALSVNHLAAANHLKDDSYRKAYKYYSSELIKQGEKPTKDLIDAFAREEENYIMYESDARISQEKTNLYKTLVEIYSGNCDRLSREYTMRQIEYK